MIDVMVIVMCNIFMVILCGRTIEAMVIAACNIFMAILLGIASNRR